MGSFDYYQIVVIVVGAYCVFRGVMTLLTGQIPKREEERLKDYSANGLRKYKLLSAFMNIFGGAFLIIAALIRLLNLVEPNLYRILLLVILAVMIVVYISIRNICKNTK